MKEIIIKIIVAGEPGSGKSIISQVNDACISLRPFGVSIGRKTMAHGKEQGRLTFLTWTLTKGRPKDSTYFKGSRAAIIVCDLTKEQTIKKMKSWANSVRKRIGAIPLVFVGNNAKKASENNVDMMLEIAKTYDSSVVLTRLDDPSSIEEVFGRIIQAIWPDSGDDVGELIL